jgi:hypothetical protein
MQEKKFNLAVLIDGDNASARLVKEILDEVSKYGKATIRSYTEIGPLRI